MMGIIGVILLLFFWCKLVACRCLHDVAGNVSQDDYYLVPLPLVLNTEGYEDNK